MSRRRARSLPRKPASPTFVEPCRREDGHFGGQSEGARVDGEGIIGVSLVGENRVCLSHAHVRSQRTQRTLYMSGVNWPSVTPERKLTTIAKEGALADGVEDQKSAFDSAGGEKVGSIEGFDRE
jgi:hypothetical protein